MFKMKVMGAVMFGLVLCASSVLAQNADEVGIDEYCGNMGTVKSVSAESIVIDGMNWDFESENETVEETYGIDASVPLTLDGYAQVSEIQEGDFIGIECENRDGKMVAVLIQSEEAINQAFEDIAEEMENIEEDAENLQEMPEEGLSSDPVVEVVQ